MYTQIGKQDIYRSNPVTVPFKWGAAGDVLLLYTNYSARSKWLHTLTIQNGATAGTTTPAAIYVTTPNTEYTVTFPANDMAAGEVMPCGLIGQEEIPPGKTLLVKMKTATSAAKDGKVNLLIEE